MIEVEQKDPDTSWFNASNVKTAIEACQKYFSSKLLKGHIPESANKYET